MTFWKAVDFRADLATKQHEHEHETELFIRVFSCCFMAKIPSSANMSTQPNSLSDLTGYTGSFTPSATGMRL